MSVSSPTRLNYYTCHLPDRRLHTDMFGRCPLYCLLYWPAAKLGTMKESLRLLKLFNVVQSVITATVSAQLSCVVSRLPWPLSSLVAVSVSLNSHA